MRRTPELDGRVLRVVCVEAADHVRVTTVFPTAMRSRPMDLRTTYDPEADAVSIRLSDERPFEGAEVEPGVIVHFAKDGRVVGLEFLPASKVLSPGAWSRRLSPASRNSASARPNDSAFEETGIASPHSP